MGLDPDPYTLRQLRWMAEGRLDSLWQPASLMMSLFANANRKPGSRRFTAADFNPFDQTAPDAAIPAKIGALKCLLPKKK